ncbi:MAG: response regulator [Candidatus Parabeggiatoa sp. nov. 3]|nr:MAG: response regulator [Gammaproteobacteria bacterium]RKZ65284.1 MAG: response regulator [Gammaproteobacteria bacterium]RKZ81872.1 MAG: response regulator [Gammaproteobacteria bacterium]
MNKLLWVKDKELCDDMAPRRLGRKGFDVVRAYDGGQAVEMAHSEAPDLILMNMNLPVKDGETAIFEIKTSETTRNIPIIALIHTMTSDKEKAIKAGCDEVDTRPIELPRLLSKINRLLSIESS